MVFVYSKWWEPRRLQKVKKVYRLNCRSCHYLLSTCRNLSLRLLTEPASGERTQSTFSSSVTLERKTEESPWNYADFDRDSSTLLRACCLSCFTFHTYSQGTCSAHSEKEPPNSVFWEASCYNLLQSVPSHYKAHALKVWFPVCGTVGKQWILQAVLSSGKKLGQMRHAFKGWRR